MLLLTLVACLHRVGPFPAPRVDYGEPVALPLVQVPEDRDRLYVLAVDEAGQPRLWFFDTGYSHTTCDATAVAEEDLPTRRTLARSRGELGSVRLEQATLTSMALGGHEVIKLRCAVRDLPATSSIPAGEGYRVYGVLGSNLLRNFIVEVDPARGLLLLHPPDSVPTEEGFRLRRERLVGHRVRAPLSLDGRESWPVLDYGAAGTYLDADGLGLPLTREVPGTWRGTGSENVERRPLRYHAVEEVRLGPVQGPSIEVVDLDRGPLHAGLLGMDVLGELRLVIDYPRRRALAERVEPRVLPLSEELTQGATAPKEPAEDDREPASGLSPR